MTTGINVVISLPIGLITFYSYRMIKKRSRPVFVFAAAGVGHPRGRGNEQNARAFSCNRRPCDVPRHA
jgi:hypothetical protein